MLIHIASNASFFSRKTVILERILYFDAKMVQLKLNWSLIFKKLDRFVANQLLLKLLKIMGSPNRKFCNEISTIFLNFRCVWAWTKWTSRAFDMFTPTFKPNECANRINSGPSVSALHPNFSPSGKTEYAASARMRKTNL